MKDLKFIGIIPARYASSRFPGKPLAKIGGIMMIERVYKRALKAINNVVVATDDERIFNAVKGFGGNVVMTSTNHKSGTDRCLEAYQNVSSNADVIINIQGDEPFIDVSQIESLKNCFNDPSVDIATLARVFRSSCKYNDLANPNTPKIVTDTNMHALYFSRSVIPYLRGINPDEWSNNYKYLAHIGMYAYKKDTLFAITKLPQSPLEKMESLEQLRWLQNGFTIKVGITDKESIGIDTIEDLNNAEIYIKDNNIDND